MNNQNGQPHNQPWRSQSYIQNSRPQEISRNQSFFNGFINSHYVNDFIQAGYSYPNMMPPYRHSQLFPTLPTNPESYSSFGILTPEAYTKYFHKVQAFLLQNSNFGVKDYEHAGGFNAQNINYRNVHSYPGMAPHIQSHGIMIEPTFINQGMHRLQKPDRPNRVIVIESDQQKTEQNNQQKKNTVHKVQQKNHKQLTKSDQVEVKMGYIPTQPQNKQKQPQSIHQRQHQPIEVQNFSPAKKSPQLQNMPQQQFFQVIPIEVIDQLQQQILEELQNASLPDLMTKLFLKYKTLWARSKYQQTGNISVKILNLLQVYRAFIWFETERKQFMDNTLAERIFGEVMRPAGKANGRHLPNGQKNNANFDPLLSFNKSIQNEEDQQPNKPQFMQQIDKIYKKSFPPFNYPPKTKKISKKQLEDRNSDDVSFNGKNRQSQKYQIQAAQHYVSERKLRQRKKKKNKKQKSHEQRSMKDKLPFEKDKSRTEKQKPQKQKQKTDIQQNNKSQNKIEFSNQDQVVIQKISRWAEKTLASAIQQKNKKSIEKPKNCTGIQNSKTDPFRVIKNTESNQLKKNKQRSTKASQHNFREMLMQKIAQSKQSKDAMVPNLITFSTSNNLSEVQKQDYQKQLLHLAKQLRNTESHGKIRVGKEYYQAKMPAFIRSQKELDQLVKQKRDKLMERKMSVLTF